MKLIAIILLFISINCSSQTVKSYLKDNWKSMTLSYTAGVCDGQVEVLSHHYNSFKKIYPNANNQFWNPNKSWTNKYKNNDVTQGDAFLFSSNGLVWTTDGYHLFKMGQKASIMGAIVFKIGEKKAFKYYLIDLFTYSACYGAGFYTTYNLIYK